MVKLTENAAIAIENSMLQANLNIKKYALFLYVYNDNLSVTFIDKNIDKANKVGNILFLVDQQVEEFHKDNNLIVDYVMDENGKLGIIFVEEKYYDLDHRKSSE